MNCLELQQSLAEVEDGSGVEQRAHLRSCPSCSATRPSPLPSHAQPDDCVRPTPGPTALIATSCPTATWATLSAQYSKQQMIELHFLVGNYVLMATISKGLGIQVEEAGSAAWKPPS